MKKIIIVLFILFNFSQNYGQSSYYYDSKRIDLQLNTKNLNILTTNNFDTSILVDTEFAILAQDSIETWYKVKLINAENNVDFYSKKNQILNDSNVKHIAYYYERGSQIEPIGTSNIFYIKLKDSNDYGLLENLCNQNNVQIIGTVPYMPLWYKLKSNTISTSIELANIFYETGYFDETDVGFTFNFQNSIYPTNQDAQSNTSSTPCVNDPEFDRQWGLDNQLNPDIDINACDAWSISDGSNVKVAIVDTGVDVTNQDLINTENTFYNSFMNRVMSFPYHTYGYHGTAMAATIGAIKNNNHEIAGIAPSCMMMDVRFADQPEQNVFPTRGEALAACISYAWQHSADVINCSWGDRAGRLTDIHSPLLIDALNNAVTQGRNGLGSVVVFGSGNRYGDINYPPNSFSHSLCVGGNDINGLRVALPGTDFGSCYGERLDVVAPGKDIPFINSSYSPQVSFDTAWGTSFSTAYTTGVAALILSVNPCLTEQQVRTIIEQTAQKIRTDVYNYNYHSNRNNGTWNIEMGYGLVDAYAAVQMAQNMNNSNVDLYIKDSPDDMGVEPNNITQTFWESTDIWIRNQQDGYTNTTHQNPEYDPNNPVYVYVRIRNKGCTASDGTDKLHLYWANANTGLSWPEPWYGHQYVNGVATGGAIPSPSIPPLNPGDETILEIPWHIPDVSNYSQVNGHWHFCLLANIDSNTDPMTFPLTADLNQNVKNNNNEAWKNVSVVDIVPNSNPNQTVVSVAVSNPYDTNHTFYLELVKDDKETGKPIYIESEVKVEMDDVLFNAWERGGKMSEEMENTNDEKKIIVKDDNAVIKNINFDPNESGILTLDFSFLTEEMTDKEVYKYRLIQKDASTNQVIGGETFIIKKPTRPQFIANADDKEIDKDEPITISAEQINEAAIYNWYDEEGNLIYQGKDLSITPEVAKKYKLEVIATADGFKDYKEVEVKLKPNRITSISPNPTTDVVNVEYKINDEATSYIMIIGTYGGDNDVNNYVIDINNTQSSIDISNYQSGYYTIALVCDGQIVDAHTIQKN